MTATVVFARMDSVRLPGKALADLCGRPMLGRVLDRVRRARLCRRVVFATSERPSDGAIASFAKSEGVEVFRGDAADVVERALGCCDALGLDAFVRISGDSPFMPPELIDRALEAMQQTDADLVTNVFPRSYPAGASVEVIKAKALRRAHERMTTDEREHVTSAFYSAPDAWRIVNFSASARAYADLRLTVDTAAELEVARALTTQLMPKPELAALDDIVALRRSLQAVA
jgi:spore coat polysaccharide biosynthesis protein SpsF